MPLLRLETSIRAPPERVFDLARDVEAHLRSASGTRERAVAGVTTGLLGLGDEVTWEATHFGIRQRLTAKVTRLERPRVFEDVMVSGAFKSFVHLHQFEPVAEGTRMLDTFSFVSPLGFLGRIADALFLERYMRQFLAERARVLKALAEGGDDASR